MKKITMFICMALFIFGFQAQAIEFKNNKEIEKIFISEKVKGTFVVYDVTNDKFIGYNKKRGEKLYCPASTFKIMNSLIGLETGAVKSVDEVFYKYDGGKVFLDSWKQDSSLRYAISVSQVPAYKELARRIGLERMQENIIKLNYGNKNIGKTVDKFWLEGPLEISAIQQTKILAQLAQKKLPYSKENQEAVIDITKLESGNNWTLHGKTGWLTAYIKPTIGWFVGWVEQDGNIYSFAINMDIKDSSELPKREEIAKKSLKILGLMQ